MEHRLPKEIKGLLPPNTMDTDFKAELYGALLSEAGFDTAQIMMVRDGNNLSNVSKDIRSVKHRNHVGIAEGAYIELKTNRRGIYDSLPEGLFHEALFPGKVKDLGLILEEMQQHRNEEFFIRRFFSLLESEVDREGIQAQLLELRYDKKNKYSDYAKLFAACFAGHSYFVRTGGVAVHQVHAAYPFDPGQTGRGKRRTVADSGSSGKGTPQNGATDNKGTKTEPAGEHETGSKQCECGGA